MRFCVLACALVACFCSVVSAQGQPSIVDEEGRELKSYTLKVTEVQFKTEAKADIDVKELPQKWKELEQSGKFSLVENVTLNLFEGHEMKVRFGKKTSFVMGRSGASAKNPQGIDARGGASINFIETGTTVKAKAEAQGAKVLVEFSYEASRWVENLTSAMGRNTVNNSIEAIFVLEPGKPILLSGSNAETGAYIIVSIE